MPFLETDFKLRDEYSFVKFKDFIIKNRKNNMDVVINGTLNTQDFVQDKLSDFVMLKERFEIDIRIFYIIGNPVESCGSVIKLFNCFERWGIHLPTNFILADFAGQKREFYDFSLQKYFKAQMRKYGSREHFLGKIDKEWVEFSESWEIPPKENDFVTTKPLAPKLWRDEILTHVLHSCWQSLCPVEAQWARLEI